MESIAKANNVEGIWDCEASRLVLYVFLKLLCTSDDCLWTSGHHAPVTHKYFCECWDYRAYLNAK